MTLTLEMARDKQVTYEPHPDILAAIHQKTLIALVGPAGSGKSSTIDWAMLLDPDFGRTGSFMTREPRSEDDPRFSRYTTQGEMLKAIAEQTLVQYIVHPTTGHLYGTDLTMYGHGYNMLETLPASIADVRRLQFGKLVIASIVSGAKSWQQWFEARYPIHDDEREKRAKEAIHNLEWSIAQPEGSIAWLENIPGKQSETARQLITIARHNRPTPDLTHMAMEMLAIAKTL